MFLSRVIRSYGIVIITLLSVSNCNSYASLRKHKITLLSVSKHKYYIYLWKDNNHASEWKHKNYVSIALLCEIIPTL